MFPEGEKQGLYHTADATLWFFHAIARYLACSGDDLTLSTLYPTLKQIIAAHVGGTRVRHPRRSGRRSAGAGRRRDIS